MNGIEKSHCCGQPTHNALKSVKSAIVFEGSLLLRSKAKIKDFLRFLCAVELECRKNLRLRKNLDFYCNFFRALCHSFSIPSPAPSPFYKDKAEKGSNLQPPSILDVRVTLISACCWKILLAGKKSKLFW